MKFFAIIFLATLSYIDNPNKTENLYSYQLQFQSYNQCSKSYEDYQDKLLNGLLGHGIEKFGNMQIDYVSCAEVEITSDLEIPIVLGQKPVYQRM